MPQMPKVQTPDPANHPLATQPVGRLILKFAIPSVIAMLVGALYNIVDQIFIGQGVGMLGNAATNVAFPLSTISTSIALLIGVGTAARFNLEMGAGNRDKASEIMGCGIASLAIGGLLLGGVTLLFRQPLLLLFGATEQVLPYAMTYTGITAFGLPLVTFTTGSSHLIRADGSPTYSMLCTLTGALLNTVLDPLFIFGLGLGIAGAAWATVIGQTVSAVLAVRYLLRPKSAVIPRRLYRPRLSQLGLIATLGAASCFNQLAMTLVQIAMNNTLTHYGALSRYGSEIPLACVGVISKVTIVFMALVIGISQGCQPLFSFNYGAGIYGRVKHTYLLAAGWATGVSVVAFACFQLFPRQIVSVFGSGSELYFAFAERYFHIFLMLTFLNGIQPLTGNFFSSIGKAKLGIVISLTRQVLFLLPLVLILPLFLGIDGVVYAGPVADGAAALTAGALVLREMRLLSSPKTTTE